MLRSEWAHERRERLEVAQDLGDGIERRLKVWIAQDPLEGIVAPWATWHLDGQTLQALDDFPQWACHLSQDGHLFVKRRQIIMRAMQPGWPIAHGELLQPREVRIQGDVGQRRRKQAKRGLLRAPDGLRQSRVEERFL